MKTSNLIPIVLFGLVSLLTSCLKDKIDEKILLSNEIKSQNPYHEKDKLYFVSDSVQVFVLEVSRRTSEFVEFQNGNYATNYLIEFEKTSIIALDTTQYFGFWLEMEGYSKPPKFKIQFSPPAGEHLHAYFDLPLSYNNPKYTDSVYVSGKWFYNIYVEETEKIDSNPYRLYYSTEFGIIKIDFSDNRTWELEKVERKKTTGNIIGFKPHLNPPKNHPTIKTPPTTCKSTPEISESTRSIEF